MNIFCHTCRRTFPAEDNNILYDNGSDMAVFKCDTCGTRYLAVADEKFEMPILLKLTITKSFVTDKQRSRIVKPTQGLIISPQQAAEEAIRRRK